ncbi:MAG: NAD-dependent epimerase/dehydratase [Alphaproteobacteria bacterium]|nr:NAD-dependent epimerase/dehydratase [Alphaproteobacteria bacterium]|tara:strand:- start:2532 stop:3476 length:945 start_codon:yes stop_codon:yes gene_type:complete
MKILITGGCGYVGSELIKYLLLKGHTITNIDTRWFGNTLKKHKKLLNLKLDIRDIEAIPMKGVDTIIHLAGIANDPSVELDEKLSWEVNVLASRFLIEKAVKYNIKNFIYASSGSVYGIKKEKQVTEELSLLPISAYNKTKMIAENVLLSYKNKINVFCVRPATVCGFSERMRLDVSVNLLTSQAIKNKKIKVLGGKQIRPNIHIKDMIRVYDFFLNNKRIKSGCYNAGFENISIIKLAQLIKKKIKCDIEIYKSNDVRSYRQSSKKLINLGFKRLYSVENAIDDLIVKFNEKKIKNKLNCYNVKWMKKNKLNG